MSMSFFARGILPLSCTFALLAVTAAGCQSPSPESDAASDPTEAPTAEAASELRTPGTNAKYFHVSTTQSISQQAEYDWSAQWHTVMRGRVDNELFLYDRATGLAKIFTMADDGTMTLKNTLVLLPGVDAWVRGNFYGGSEKELVSYERDSGAVKVYEVSSGGAMTLRFSTTVASGYALAFSGNWGSVFDDLVFYDRGRGTAKYYTSTGISFTLVHTTTWAKIWDHIVPGRFNNDAFTDLLFYNQDSGLMNVYTLNSSRVGTQTQVATDWPMTPYSVVTVGEFGGSSSTDDVLVYDPRNGFDPVTGKSNANGRGTFYLSSTAGVLSKGAEYTNWQKKWTHIPTLKQSTRTTSDLVFYSNAFDINVVPVRVANNDGTQKADLSSCQLNRWLDAANDAYRGAGIHFVWDGTFKDLNDSWLNSYACSGDTEFLKDHADFLATNSFGAPDKLVVYFRAGGGGGSGCGSPERQYMIMPDYDGTGTTYSMRDGSTGSVPQCAGASSSSSNIKLFAHEVGHYFGLAHTYWSGASQGIPDSYASMDQDRSPSPFTPVWDTSATPSGDFWNGDDPNADGSAKNRCDDSATGEFTYPTISEGTITLNPDRHNVMINGVNCDFTYNLTPGQIDAVRLSLFSNRSDLTQ